MAVPPALIAAGVQVGSQALGGLVSRLIAGKPESPDLINPAINAANQQLSDRESDLRRQQALLESDLARAGSSGFSGAAAREDLLNANARGNANVRANIVDLLANARQKQEILENQISEQNRSNVSNSIISGLSAAGEGVSNYILQDELTNSLKSDQLSLDPVSTELPDLNLDVGIRNSRFPVLPSFDSPTLSSNIFTNFNL